MISILCPTRGRPRSVDRLLRSLRATTVGAYEVVLYCDIDDPDTPAVQALEAENVRVLVGPRMIHSQYWNACSEVARYDIWMQCGDDIRFRTPGWDVHVLSVFRRFPDNLVLVYADDGFQHQNLATHSFLHRRWAEVVGYMVPPYFASDYSDTWLTEVAGALGRLVYLPDVLTEHLHPAAGKGVWDQTHRDRLARHAAEGVDSTWMSTAHLRRADVGKLRVAMESLV